MKNIGSFLNFMMATRLKKLEWGQYKAGKVSGTQKQQLEEQFASN